MEIIIGAFFTVAGLLIGSFLNVVIDRLPAGLSIVNPPSHCQSCQKKLAVADLIPVISYLMLKGRCRYCQAVVPLRSLLVELVTGIAFGVLFFQIGLNFELAVALFYFCLLAAIFVIDLERQLILNWLTYPAILMALLFSLFHTQLSGPTLSIPDPVHALIGAGAGFVLFAVIVLVSRGGMGGGDIMMATLMGAMLGYPLIFTGIFMGIIGGGLIAVLLLVFKRKGRKDAIAFGPFLALGTLAALFWGQALLSWYLSLFA